MFCAWIQVTLMHRRVLKYHSWKKALYLCSFQHLLCNHSHDWSKWTTMQDWLALPNETLFLPKEWSDKGQDSWRSSDIIRWMVDLVIDTVVWQVGWAIDAFFGSFSRVKEWISPLLLSQTPFSCLSVRWGADDALECFLLEALSRISWGSLWVDCFKEDFLRKNGS